MSPKSMLHKEAGSKSASRDCTKTFKRPFQDFCTLFALRLQELSESFSQLCLKPSCPAQSAAIKASLERVPQIWSYKGSSLRPSISIDNHKGTVPDVP